MNLSVIVLVAANLVPLVGVVFWGWDAFVLLVLYWMETAIIGVWMIVRILVMPAAEVASINVRSGNGRPVGRIGTALFFLVHAGMFMTVHFLFLWQLFSGDWPTRIHDAGNFIGLIVIGTGLWLPLLILFLVRGWFALRPILLPRLSFLAPDPASSAGEDGNSLFLGLYIRIFIMQVAIICGGWLAMISGASIGALALLVVGKTLAELFFGPLTRYAAKATDKAVADRDPTA